MIEIYAIDEKGLRKLIDDLYWFEENGIHDFGGEGHWGEKYTFEIYVSGSKVYPIEAGEPAKCNCKCSDPGMWHDQGCPMRQLPDSGMWSGARCNAGEAVMDEFTLRYAKRIWPAITENTKTLIDFGDRSQHVIMGTKGTETVDLITCNDAEYAKWGYAPNHDLLILVDANQPQIKNVAVWNGDAWRELERFEPEKL